MKRIYGVNEENITIVNILICLHECTVKVTKMRKHAPIC